MAIAMVALMAFSALVIDYGIFWVARRQAQNSADAGALAGAIALAFDDPDGLLRTGPAQAERDGRGTGQPRVGLGAVGAPTPTSRSRPARIDPAGHLHQGGRVSAPSARNNSLPTFFGKLVGVNTQDVQATATARS